MVCPWTRLLSCPRDADLTSQFPGVPRHLAGRQPHPAGIAVLWSRACCRRARHPASSGTTQLSTTANTEPGAGRVPSTSLCPPCVLAMAVCQPDAALPGVPFLRGSCSYLQMLDACPAFPWQGQPSSPLLCCGSKPHAPSVPGTWCLWCLQARPRLCRVVLTLPFCLLFTIFQICPF